MTVKMITALDRRILALDSVLFSYHYNTNKTKMERKGTCTMLGKSIMNTNGWGSGYSNKPGYYTM